MKKLVSLMLCLAMVLTVAGALAERGFNVLVIDGPGQGISNIRGLKIKGDNYERAASACIDWLLQRPEVDPERLGSIGFSFGTYMNLRVFALDKRLKAASGLAAKTSDGRWYLTPEGFLVSNSIISDLLLIQEKYEPLAKKR